MGDKKKKMNVRSLVTLLAAALLTAQAPAPKVTPAPKATPAGLPTPRAVGPTPAPRISPLAPGTGAPGPSAPAGARPAPGPGTGFSFEDWHVSTAQLDANWQTGAFNTPTHITLTRTGSTITADRATGNFKTHSAVLTGHVVVHDTNGVLTNFAGQSGPHVPATLTCDNLNIDGVKKNYVATGNVYFSQGGSQARAQRAVMDGVTHEIHLLGNVQLTQ